MRDQGWSILFAVSVSVLMLTILTMRSEPAPAWLLVVYPLVGGLLGLAASRTSPSAEQMAWIESSTIAAAAVVLLAALVNLLLVDMLMRELRTGHLLGGDAAQQTLFFATPTIAVVFWWALQRRLSRMRLEVARRQDIAAAGIPAE